MSRFRKKATFMNMFGRAEDDRSLLHSSSKLDGSIGDMSGTYRKDTELDQPTSESPEEFSLNFISTAASTDTPSTQTASPRKAQSNIINEVDGGDDQQQYLESPKAVSPEREHRVDREKSVSPRRGIREKLRSTLTAAGDHPVSPTKSFMRKTLSERIMGTAKSSSPKGGKVNHIGEIKVNFATIAEQPSQPPEIKAETDSPPKHNKKLLKSFSKMTRKPKVNGRIDAVASDSANTKVTATVQTVHSSDLQHSFYQLNLGEMVPEVVCEAVKSKELMDALKKRNKDLYMIDDSSSSEDESSTDVSEESIDTFGNEADERRGNEANDIPRSKSAENSNDDFFAHMDEKDDVEVESHAHIPGGCSADTKTTESTGPIEKEKLPSGEHTGKSRKPKKNELVDVGRKPRRSKNNDVHTEHEVRTWVRSSSRPRRRSTKESAALQTVELAFSPPSSPKIETPSRLGVAENDIPSDHQTIKTRRSPQSNKGSPRQRTLGDAFANRKPSDEMHVSSMPGELNDPASDTRFAEMKAVLDDFERMAISDFLKHPNEHLKDVDFNMSTVPFESCYIDVKDLDFSENTNMDVITGVVGGDGKLIDPSPDQADVNYRYRLLCEELEQSRIRLALSSQDVSRVEQIVEQLKQRLEELKRR